MQVSVNLQNNYSYLPLIVTVLIFIFSVVIVLLWAKKELAPKKPESQKLPEKKVTKSPVEIKRTYDKLLLELYEKSQKEEITSRRAHQQLSRLVREFSYEMTGVKIQNCTLKEIQEMNLPSLTALIQDCYVPEFAKEDNGDINEMINKARKVVKEWI